MPHLYKRARCKDQGLVSSTATCVAVDCFGENNFLPSGPTCQHPPPFSFSLLPFFLPLTHVSYLSFIFPFPSIFPHLPVQPSRTHWTRESEIENERDRDCEMERETVRRGDGGPDQWVGDGGTRRRRRRRLDSRWLEVDFRRAKEFRRNPGAEPRRPVTHATRDPTEQGETRFSMATFRRDFRRLEAVLRWFPSVVDYPVTRACVRPGRPNKVMTQ
jgi:hypothetical protein